MAVVVVLLLLLLLGHLTAILSLSIPPKDLLKTITLEAQCISRTWSCRSTTPCLGVERSYLVVVVVVAVVIVL